MDSKRIGEFLKQLRKENGMTQEQLGQKVGVNNKTVSRWETGSYMPPVECLKALSEMYHISINEILAGARAVGEDFTEMAENNIQSALNEREKENQIFENRMLWILAITTILTVAILALLPAENLKDLIVAILVVALAFIANTLNIIALAAKKGSK